MSSCCRCGCILLVVNVIVRDIIPPVRDAFLFVVVLLCHMLPCLYPPRLWHWSLCCAPPCLMPLSRFNLSADFAHSLQQFGDRLGEAHDVDSALGGHPWEVFVYHSGKLVRQVPRTATDHMSALVSRKSAFLARVERLPRRFYISPFLHVKLHLGVYPSVYARLRFVLQMQSPPRPKEDLVDLGRHSRGCGRRLPPERRVGLAFWSCFRPRCPTFHPK